MKRTALVIVLFLLTHILCAQTIKIIPLNGFSNDKLSVVVSHITDYYHINVIMGSRQIINDRYIVRGTNKYCADSILEVLILYSSKNTWVVGLTSVDICSEENGYPSYGIFGLSFMGKPACVISDHRLRNEKQLYNTVLHEIGHMYGLDHCPNPKCIMHAWEPNIKNWEDYMDMCPKCLKILQSKKQ